MIDISKGRFWDFGWKLIDGCDKCSPGCENCWSLAMEKRFRKGDTLVTVHPERLNKPLIRRRPAVYALWNDAFHPDVGWSFMESVAKVIKACPQHTFLILTKRPSIMKGFTTWMYEVDFTWPDNVYLGLTICNQQEADEKIPIFLKVPGKKFLSIEPMLEEIDLRWTYDEMNYRGDGVHQIERIPFGVDAVILGGETGPKARPMHIGWARFVRDHCRTANIPFFLKHIGKKEGRILDGITHDDLPWIKAEGTPNQL